MESAILFFCVLAAVAAIAALVLLAIAYATLHWMTEQSMLFLDLFFLFCYFTLQYFIDSSYEEKRSICALNHTFRIPFSELTFRFFFSFFFILPACKRYVNTF